MNSLLSDRFNVRASEIAGVFFIERLPRGDDRGFLERLFEPDFLESLGWPGMIAQINHTFTRSRGTIRGMHFQKGPVPDWKMVTCLRGQVFDCVVDLRLDSPTYLQWVGQELSGKNHFSMLIPSGCAHGLQTMTDNVDLVYFHSAPYMAQFDLGINPFDQELKIKWPLACTEISDRDKNHPDNSKLEKGANK